MTAPRVAVLSGTTPLHIAMHSLTSSTGRLVLVPMPMRSNHDGMLEHLRLSGAHRIVADPAHGMLAQRIAEQAGLPFDVTEAPPTDLADLPPRPAPYACLRTGGTTGDGTFIDIPRASLAMHRRAAMRRLEAGPESVWLASLPLWHVGGVGLVERCMHGGGGLQLPEPGALHIPEGITHVSVVPTMLHRLIASQPSPSSLRCVLVGGDRLAPDLARLALRAGWPVYASYGLTEACGQVATATPDEVAAEPGTCGMPLDGVRVRIEQDGTEADEGAEGEIVIEGPTLAVPGPLRTGDIGRLDAQGRLTVLGRAGDRITTGGEKVHPERVEEMLRSVQGVQDAGVVGVPDAEWGQRVVAFIVADAGHKLALEARVRAAARARLAVHEVPRQVHVVETLPRNAAGKLRRAVLRQWAQPG